MTDEQYMHRCLQLAAMGKGATAPNPLVGAVLVCKGRIIGEGYHQAYGGAHAEVNCFESVSEENRHLIPLSTLYVNLEPCAHFGKTPPCAQRIVKEAVKKVVVCNRDPFKQVDGKGIAILMEHQIEVVTGVLEQEGLWLNRRFFTLYELDRPYIVLKWAQTEDGLFAPADRSRFQMSDEYSTRLSHQWRREEAAIMVGFNTALNDNPQLLARFGHGGQPLRIAIDKNLRLPATHHLLSPGEPVWIINEHRDDIKGNIRFVRIIFDEDLVNNLMKLLFEARIVSLIVEGGAYLLEHMIRLDLWDEARVFSTPAVLSRGIAAPVLHAPVKVSEVTLAGDQLLLYINRRSKATYSGLSTFVP